MQKKILAKALTEAARIIKLTRYSHPLMSRALLSFDISGAQLLAADFDRKICAWFDLGSDFEGTAVYAIDPRQAGKVLRAMAGDSVDVGRFLSLCNCVAYDLGDALFMAASIGPAYLASRMRRVNMEAAPLRRLISKTSFAMSQDETRPHLNGAWLESHGDGKVRMVTTDGHRLARSDVDWPYMPRFSTRQTLESKTSTPGVIIPAAGVSLLDRALKSRELLDDRFRMAIATEKFSLRKPTSAEARRKKEVVEYKRDPQHLVIEVGNMIASILLTAAEFPPYEQVIPREFQRSISVDRKALMEALERVKLSAPPKTAGCRLNMTAGHLNLETDNAGKKYNEALPLYASLPHDFAIGVSAKYLLDPLAEMDGKTVRISMNDELSPMLLQSISDDYNVSVAMPMRL